jgi:hypothetical protein
MSHKFAVGQVVVFVPDDGGAAANLAAMATIIRLLPMEAGEYQYHIQLGTEGVQRRARENQLRAT